MSVVEPIEKVYAIPVPCSLYYLGLANMNIQPRSGRQWRWM